MIKEWTTIRVPTETRKKAERLLEKVRRQGWESLKVNGSPMITLGSIFDVAIAKLEDSCNMDK